MGLFNMLQKQEKKRSIGVCIPLHEQNKIELELSKAQEKVVIDKKIKDVENSAIEVNGYYEVMGTAMLSGRVLKGRINKKQKAMLNDKEYKIAEIQKAHRKVDFLEEGDNGAVFLKGKGLLVQTGQIIELK